MAQGVRVGRSTGLGARTASPIKLQKITSHWPVAVCMCALASWPATMKSKLSKPGAEPVKLDGREPIRNQKANWTGDEGPRGQSKGNSVVANAVSNKLGGPSFLEALWPIARAAFVLIPFRLSALSKPRGQCRR